jgi:capsid portal protein
MIGEFDVVEILIDMPESWVTAGMQAAIVDTLQPGQAWLAEVFDNDGNTVGVVYVEAQHIRLIEHYPPRVVTH